MEEFVMVEETERIVNPNVGRPYTITFEGRKIVIEPLEIKRIPKKLSHMVLEKANKMHSDMKLQQQEERSNFRVFSESSNPKMKDQAHKFGKLDAHGNIVTVTQAPPFPWLISLDSPGGQAVWEQAKELAKKSGVPVYEEEDNLETVAVNEVVKVRPSEEWDRDDLREWIDNHGGTYGPNEDVAKLTRKAQRLFDAQTQMLLDAGVKVKVE